MDADRFRAICRDLNWSFGFMGRVLDRDNRLVRRWASGENRIEDAVANWLEIIAANPPPPRPPRRTTPYPRDEEMDF
jgi:hypothetical protein